MPPASLKNPPPVQDDQDYTARRSNRVASDLAVADGDTWTERLTVCEGPDKLVVRSYYKNSRTAERVWGEPPSGASNVKHADDSMRKEADMRLHDLQSTLDMIPTEKNTATPSKKEKSGFLKRFRKKEKKPRDDSKDLNLQRAIARSMTNQQGAGSSSDEPVVLYDQQQYQGDGDFEEDDALQMAKALSMSESSTQQQQQPTIPMSEAEMLQQALEASRLEACGVAYYIPDTQRYSHQAGDFSKDPPGSALDDEDGDKKMPAK